MSPATCFIGGSGRSGTIALKEAFARHPECATIHVELRLFVDPDGIVDFYTTFRGGWEPYLYDSRLRRLESLLRQIGRNNLVTNAYRYAIGKTGLNRRVPVVVVPRYAELGLRRYCPRYAELVDALIGDLTDFRYRARWVGSEFLQSSAMTYKSPLEPSELARILRKFLVGFIGEVLRHQKARHFFDSTPRALLWFVELRELLPEAKLVHVYRDPRDVTASFARSNFAPSRPAEAARMVRDILERWWKVRSLLPRASFKEIALEDLVADPEATLRGVSDFLSIEWDQRVLSADLTHAHSGRWRKDFTTDEQRQVCDILAPTVAALGYSV